MKARYNFHDMQPGDTFIVPRAKAGSVFGLCCRYNKQAGKKLWKAKYHGEDEVLVTRLVQEGEKMAAHAAAAECGGALMVERLQTVSAFADAMMSPQPKSFLDGVQVHPEYQAAAQLVQADFAQAETRFLALSPEQRGQAFIDGATQPFVLASICEAIGDPQAPSIADKLLQKNRKAGKIVYDRDVKVWRKTA